MDRIPKIEQPPRLRGVEVPHNLTTKLLAVPGEAAVLGEALDLLGLGLTVRSSAVGVGVNSALQCGWGWG